MIYWLIYAVTGVVAMLFSAVRTERAHPSEDWVDLMGLGYTSVLVGVGWPLFGLLAGLGWVLQRVAR